jgi:hypothetical protein
VGYWREVGVLAEGCPVPVPDGVAGETGVSVVEGRLDGELGWGLMAGGLRGCGVEPLEVVLAAVARAFGGVLGLDRLVVGVESHGRFELPGLGGVERTVGWFTGLFPVVVSSGGELGDCLGGVCGALRGVPGHGLGYQLLVRSERIDRVGGLVSVNYLGDVGMGVGGIGGGLGLSSWPAGLAVAPENHLPFPVGVDCGLDGDGLFCRLTFDRSWCAVEVAQALVDEVIASVGELVSWCSAGGEVPDAGVAGVGVGGFVGEGLTADEMEEILDVFG